MSGVNLANYTNLSKYAVLAGNTITNTGTTTVNSGYWYAPTIAGPNLLTSGTSPSGLNSALSGNASSELSTLISDITTYTAGLTNVNIGVGGSNYTFLPNRSYTGTGISYASGEILTFDAQGDSNAQFFITANGAFTFVSNTFNLTNGAQSCNIYWLSNPVAGAGGFTVTTPATNVPGIIITTGTTTSSSTFTITSQNIIGHIYSKTSVTFTSTGSVNVNSNTCPIVCYLKGTLILTKRGFVPIENIKAGHQVITKGKIYKNKFINEDDQPKLEPAVWVSKFRVFDLNSKSRPICIKKDALGENRPFQDLYVSPGHSLLLNGRMVLAKNMVNGTTIYQDKEIDNIEYYHLECERHIAIVANGILSESYLDVNNRDVFENSIRLRPKINLKKLNFLSR